ncbi:hypothetical protein EYC80_009477 [Monilinia laxa]|uniref:Uncharacterized protein n=1 Tax=Monilinia laxa TaxID=61186 RepID=A0A5N6JY27_MONLA|nr:hypothetical protein EYC80_009477 [Monilinia laxa]
MAFLAVHSFEGGGSRVFLFNTTFFLLVDTCSFYHDGWMKGSGSYELWDETIRTYSCLGSQRWIKRRVSIVVFLGDDAYMYIYFIYFIYCSYLEDV